MIINKYIYKIIKFKINLFGLKNVSLFINILTLNKV